MARDSWAWLTHCKQIQNHCLLAGCTACVSTLVHIVSTMAAATSHWLLSSAGAAAAVAPTPAAAHSCSRAADSSPHAVVCLRCCPAALNAAETQRSAAAALALARGRQVGAGQGGQCAARAQVCRPDQLSSQPGYRINCQLLLAKCANTRQNVLVANIKDARSRCHVGAVCSCDNHWEVHKHLSTVQSWHWCRQTLQAEVQLLPFPTELVLCPLAGTALSQRSSAPPSVTVQ